MTEESQLEIFGCLLYNMSLQNFKLIETMVFVHLKDLKDLVDAKIPLLFKSNDAIVEKWIDIDRNYVVRLLPYSNGMVDKTRELKRKPLVQMNFKPLYKMCTED